MGKKGKGKKDKLLGRKSKPENTMVEATQPRKPWSAIKSTLPTVFSSIGFLLVGFGVPEMSAGSPYAPWLIGIGSLLVAIAIISFDDFRRLVTSWPKLGKRWVRVIVYLIICIILCLPVLLITRNTTNERAEILAKTPIYYGELTPNDLPIPEMPSSPYQLSEMPGYIMLMLGDDSAVFTKRTDSIVLSNNDKQFLSIGLSPSGTLILDAEVLDSTNNRVIKIVKNEFQANPVYAFNPRQPNKHELIVRDSNGVEVLNIQYINPSVMRVVGRFFIPSVSEPFIILPNGEMRFQSIVLNRFYAKDTGGSTINIGD